MTQYELFATSWRDCQKCDLHHNRQQVVLARGCVPCDILFVGEAPGQSENSVGKPFVGPAGLLLDVIVTRGVGGRKLCCHCRRLLRVQNNCIRCNNGHLSDGSDGLPIRTAFTNLIACIPLEDPEAGAAKKLIEPPYDSVLACALRLQEFMELARPRLVVCVGRHAEKWLEPGFKDSIKLPDCATTAVIQHPSYMLRQSLIQQVLLVQRAAVHIATAIDKTL